MNDPKLKILIAGNDDLWNNSVKLALNEAGFVTSVANDGIEAKKMLDQEAYDLAVLDLYMTMMPTMDILKRLQQENKRIPVLVLSPENDSEKKKMVLSEGAVGYLVKPMLDINSFPSLVRRYMD